MLARLTRAFFPYRGFTRKLDVSRALDLNYGLHHRSGWNWAVGELERLHRPDGVFFDAFLERTFVFGEEEGEGRRNPRPITRPWVGFVHCPSRMPDWYFPEMSPHRFLRSGLWRESEKFCRGLFCLSQIEKTSLQKLTDVPIDSIHYPTETPGTRFSMARFSQNPRKSIVQIGYWLRKMHSIHFLDVPSLHKAVLPGYRPEALKAVRLEREIFGYEVDPSSVTDLGHLENAAYDELLSQNLAFLDLYDASANNAVVECIVRNTPLLISRLPATIEYLGEKYPLYFQDLEEASEKANDFRLIEETHEYLKALPIKKKLSFDSFLLSLAGSKIYESLP